MGQFRPYLLGRPFTVQIDHSALQWLYSFKEPEGQVARWLESLAEADEQAQDIASPADNIRRSTRQLAQRQPSERLGTWVYF